MNNLYHDTKLQSTQLCRLEQAVLAGDLWGQFTDRLE